MKTDESWETSSQGYFTSSLHSQAGGVLSYRIQWRVFGVFLNDHKFNYQSGINLFPAGAWGYLSELTSNPGTSALCIFPVPVLASGHTVSTQRSTLD